MSNWYLQNGKESDVVISSCVSLSRNFDGFKFVNKNSEGKDIEKVIEGIIPNIGYDLKILKFKDMDELTKRSLTEKNIIDVDYINRDNISILINDEENICIIINGDDHLKLKVFSEGLAIEDLKNLAIEIDKKIENFVKYAYSDKYGYLTACPVNIGTGMKISTIVHLPGLSKTKNLSKVLRIINNFGMSVKSVNPENLNSKNCVYQITNNQTLGITEEEISKNMKLIIEKVIEQERIARQYLGEIGLELENDLYKSFGLLMYSKLMPQDKCIDLLSDVKLGTDMGIISELDDLKIKKLWLYTKTANLQKYYGQVMDKNTEEIKRAEIIKNIIKS